MKMKIVHDEILKYALNDNVFAVGEWKDKILVSPDGAKVYIIPEHNFFLDLEKILHGRPKFEADSYIKDECDAKQILITNELRKLQNMNVVKIGEKWVDKKNLKAFENPQFKTTKRRFSPIYIYENSNLVGFILPVVMK